jgi:PAS domain S-box-containing protein
MATSTVPLALAIMAHPQTRQANTAGAGIAVFTPDLASLLWANTAGADFFGIEAPGPRPAGEGVGPSPAARQLRAAARMLAGGATAARLRGPGGALVDASVTPLALEGHDPLVLVVVPPASTRSETPETIARRLLAESGAVAGQIRTAKGERFFGAPDINADDETVAAFLTSGESWRLSGGGVPVVLARVGDDHVLLCRPAMAEAAPDAAGETASDADAPDETPATERPAPRGTGMSAILTRWFARHPGGASPEGGAAEDDVSDLIPDTQAVGTPAGATGKSSDISAPEDAPADSEPTQAPRPLRSVWGPPVTLAEPDAADDDAAEAEAAPADADGQAEMPSSDEPVAAMPDDVIDDAESDGAERGEAEPASRPATAADFPELPADDDFRAPAQHSGDEGSDQPEPHGEAQEPSGEETERFEPRFDIASVRFVWRIDSEGRFRSLSPEFSAAVGPRSADVVDRSFADVARAYGLDPEGAVTRLLERRDTWSGRTVHWPVENSDTKAPVDLAALPVYARDRSFDGFRGFGIVRLAEAIADPDALGLAMAGAAFGDSVPGEEDEATPRAVSAPSDPEAPAPFGRRAVADLQRQSEAASPKVIRLEERRRPRDSALSQAEEDAFRRIGQTLSDEPAPQGLGEAIRMAAQRIEAFDEAAPGPEDAPEEAGDRATDPAEGALPERDAGVAETGEDEEVVEPAAASDGQLLEELATVYGHLPLPVLVQIREVLAFGNREFLDLTGYGSIEALEAEGGLAHLFTDRDDRETVAGELAIRRATGDTVNVRTHMQRSTIAGRSCLVMSFFASPGASAAALRGEVERDEPAQDEEVRRLRHEVEELSTVLDTATDGVVFIDSAGNIRSMNGSAHALFGIAEDDSAGRPFVTLFAHESQKATMEYLESLRNGGASSIVNEGREVIGRVAQGGFIPLSITLGPLPDDRGWCAVIRDIAHWKRVEEDLTTARRQAEAASLQKSQFLTNVSHELRTPLNAIIGFADVMATECFGPIGNDRYLEYLEDIKRSGHHVLDLVNDLLDISKIEAGKLDLSFEAVSLNAVMAEVVALMQPQANRERVLVRSNLPSSVPPVVADHRSIRQIAMNLVSNAIRFTPPGGQIIVSTSYVAEGDVALRFRDSGIGMSEHEIEIAMLPFQQVNPTSRRRGEGTGLGLPADEGNGGSQPGEFRHLLHARRGHAGGDSVSRAKGFSPAEGAVS